MSECHVFDGWCSVHGGRESCTASGQVPHLIARAEAAEVEVERLTAMVGALKTACQHIQADLDGSLGLVIDRAEIQPHLDALDDAGVPGWWLS